MKNQTTKYSKNWQPARWSCALIALSSVALLSAACGDSTEGVGGSTPLVQSKEFALLPAPNCDIVRDRLIDATTEQALDSLYNAYYRDFNDMNNAEAAPGDSNDNAGSDAPDDYTETNVQEAGVDEPDIIKTDGKFIYTTKGNELLIIKSWPANETTIVGRHSLGSNGYAGSLFLQGDRVAVFSQVYDNYYGNEDSPGSQGSDVRPEGYRHFYGTRITILDVSDRTAPKVEKQLDVEGWMNDARMIDGKVYLVSNSEVNTPFNLWDWARKNEENSALPTTEWTDNDDLREQRKNEARPLVKQMMAKEFAEVDIKTLMPRARTSDSAGKILSTVPIYECNDLYLPQQVTTLGLLNISSFDLTAPANIESTGLLANGWTVYASKQSLYIAMSSQSWWWGRAESKNESHIHKFELTKGVAKPAYMASGKVDGWLLNQFSMSEYDNHLRVATTDNQWDWSGGGEGIDKGGNNIIVLKQKNNILEETGAVRGLAPGERIYAARMIGPKGYMVTFRQTDPLYTFDLSDHTKPKMLGELKINGYSSYIHPIANDSLLTIGMDADDTGRVKGVQIQIFDVKDMKNPTRSHQHVIETGEAYSHSEALYDHHAFTYDAKREILAVPVSIYNYNGNDYFTGLIIFKANAKDGIKEIGRVSHADLVSRAYCHDQSQPAGCNPNEGWHWWSDMRRSIFMGGGEAGNKQDYVYSLSTVGLKVNDLYTPENEHAAVLFR